MSHYVLVINPHCYVVCTGLVQYIQPIEGNVTRRITCHPKYSEAAILKDK